MKSYIKIHQVISIRSMLKFVSFYLFKAYTRKEIVSGKYLVKTAFN